ncbi:MAG: citrate/2-methylcitrate synthase [Clostridiales bacterium]|nr:citrate/2-methylcitrate synthase [Clostridiales bacterium]
MPEAINQATKQAAQGAQAAQAAPHAAAQIPQATQPAAQQPAQIPQAAAQGAQAAQAVPQAAAQAPPAAQGAQAAQAAPQAAQSAAQQPAQIPQAAQPVQAAQAAPQAPQATALIENWARACASRAIDPALYAEYKVNRGLRDINGNGVLTGLSRISQVSAKEIVDGAERPTRGKLLYHGISIESIVDGFIAENRFGFEETAYLLLFGRLPNERELGEFSDVLRAYCSLPPSFVRDAIMKAPASDMMNTLARSVLMLYYYDPAPDDVSLPNILRQCLQLIAQFPLLAVYGYQAYSHYEKGESLIIHQPAPELSPAGNILSLLRPDKQYTDMEARILDLALVLHAEHGGGNNSTFTVHVVSSSDTDTYSVMAAALGSLKGPKHGGANIRVTMMMKELMQEVRDWSDEGQVADYLRKLLRREAFDRAGLIYGIGHAVYSLSDPRAVIFDRFVRQLSADKGRDEEYMLYKAVARLAPEIIASERKMYKGVSPNIDFYSGFVYDMLNLPTELFTPIFAISRIAGWSAHRIEELVNASKIIRPAYKSVAEPQPYVPLHERA